MNILRHKKWHVRTKENVARVRRDEAKAAEEEKARAERAAIAENEDRVRRLKARAQSAAVASAQEIFGGPAAEGTSSSLADFDSKTKHVNLFAELEEQERKNLTVGNREYEAEKKKEQDDWESKVGIMKRFAEDTKEYAKEGEWWEGIPMVRERMEVKEEEEEKKGKKRKKEEKFVTKEEKRAKRREEKRRKKEEEKRKKKEKRKRKEGRHASPSSSLSSSDSEEERRKKKIQLEKLRMERLIRERQEKQRTKRLLEPPKEEEKKPEVKKSQADMDRERKYNSQFNPELAR